MLKQYAIVNLRSSERLEDGAGSNSSSTCRIQGIVKAEKSGIKILGNGELTKKLTVKAAKFSKSDWKKLSLLKGGSVEVI